MAEISPTDIQFLPMKVMRERFCPHCLKLVSVSIEWVEQSNSDWAISEHCNTCGVWLSWLPKTERNKKLAGPRPEGKK